VPVRIESIWEQSVPALGSFRQRRRAVDRSVSAFSTRQRGLALGLNGFDWVRFVIVIYGRRSDSIVSLGCTIRGVQFIVGNVGLRPDR